MSEPTRRSRAVSLTYLAVLTTHATLAGIALCLLPGEFPMSHPRFWLNRVIPSLILIVAAAHTGDRRNAATQCRLRDVRNRLQVEDRMLHVDHHEVVAGRFRQARNVARAAKARQHAERRSAGLEAFLDGIGQGYGFSHWSCSSEGSVQAV